MLLIGDGGVPNRPITTDDVVEHRMYVCAEGHLHIPEEPPACAEAGRRGGRKRAARHAARRRLAQLEAEYATP